jgi:hypothetical protein
MSPKQQKFINEYLVDGNGTQAVKRAGYKVKDDDTAAVIANENLRKPKIASVIEAKQAELSNATRLTAEWVREKLYDTITNCAADNPSAAVAGLNLAAKLNNMITDKSEVNLNIDGLTPEQRQAKINELIAKRGSSTP